MPDAETHDVGVPRYCYDEEDLAALREAHVGAPITLQRFKVRAGCKG